MPWNDFGPTDWKTGTLIGFIRRAYTHSSDFAVMHVELQGQTFPKLHLGQPKCGLCGFFRQNVGYFWWSRLIHKVCLHQFNIGLDMPELRKRVIFNHCEDLK